MNQAKPPPSHRAAHESDGDPLTAWAQSNPLLVAASPSPASRSPSA